jgi:prepilin-type N-terminal cleavage/methylation domain-containing protein
MRPGHPPNRGFTLFELIIGVTVVSVVAVAILVAVDPVKRFAEARNAKRRIAVRSLADALRVYAYDHLKYPPGLDGNLRLIGTDSSGCSMTCGELLARSEVNEPLLVQLARQGTSWANPFAVQPAQAQGGGTGWVSPDGHLDPNNQWTSEPQAYDGSVLTYAQNEYGGTGWGEYIYLTLTNPIYSDRVRINADYLNVHINQVQVDVFKDGAWETVFTGGDQATWNTSWVELPFTAGQVSQARFRFDYRAGGYYYWLYDFEFYQAAQVINPPSTTTLSAAFVSRNGATFQGQLIDDGGEPTEYRFRYGETVSYGQFTPWTGSLASGDQFSQFVSGLLPNTEYHFQAQVQNSAGTAFGPDQEFVTVEQSVGWVLPTGHDDPSSTWEDYVSARDGNPGTYARSYHNIGATQWSEPLILTTDSINADALRIHARGLPEVSQLDVDVERDGAWEDVYEGTFTGQQWVVYPFPEGDVTAARIRFYAAVPNQGFFWQLNELQFQRLVESTEDACLDLAATLVPEYLAEMPVDPRDGDESQTLYAVRKLDNGRVEVYACNPELGETIVFAR